MVNNTEVGKAYLQLAQIMIIFAGFLFATGGVAYTNSMNTLSNSVSLINQYSAGLVNLDNGSLSDEVIALYDSVNELNQKYLNISMPQVGFTQVLFLFGGITTFFALLLWYLGFRIIKKSSDS